ncbi:PTS sugar transporter subunit IIA [Candidatus Latescibacterota bacterium]
MIEGLIVGHRDIGAGILKALKSISGSFEHLSYISNEGFSTTELVAEIKSSFSSDGENELIIFIDVYGGSCWQAAKIAKPIKSHIITGVNLPMLLSFINKRELFSLDELPAILEKDGKRGIKSE